MEAVAVSISKLPVNDLVFSITKPL